MVSNSRSSWTVRSATFLLWALAAAAAGYWGLKLTAGSASGPSVAQPARTAPAADPAAIARLLGHAPAASAAAPVPALASRFSLVGVVAARSREGAALISVDGRPAKPFRVGSPVDPGLVLQSVEPRRAVLAADTQGPAVLTLELPPLPR
jgi:general secretion pathway protein C